MIDLIKQLFAPPRVNRPTEKATPLGLFLGDGSFNQTPDNCKVIDAILIIMNASDAATIDAVQLELLRCGFLIQMPDMKKLWAFLQGLGLIKPGGGAKPHMN